MVRTKKKLQDSIPDNGRLSLIRQAEKYFFDMAYEVQTWYDCPET